MVSRIQISKLSVLSFALVLTMALSACQIKFLTPDSENPVQTENGADAPIAEEAEEAPEQEQAEEITALADDETSETPVVPLSDRVIESVFGDMVWFESEANDFAILRPEPWEEIPAEQCGSPGATVCFVGGPGGMIITEEPLDQMPQNDRNREGYVDFLFEIFEEGGRFKIEQFTESRSAQDHSVDIFTLSNEEDEVFLDRFIFVDEENGVAFNATIFIAAEMHDQLSPAIRYIQNSFRFWPRADRTDSAIHHLDEGRWHASQEEYGLAIDAFSRAIELDPELRIAYQSRGWLYQEENTLDRALADFNRVIELSPNLPGPYHDRGLIQYLLHTYDEALVDLEKAIELEPENPSHNNLRALVHAVSGDPESGLEDMDAALEKSGDELPIHIQDTRGFVYLVLGEYEKAKDDYDAIFAQEQQFGHALLGAGIAYFEVGETDSGIALIEAGLAEFEEKDLENPEPQLEALMEMADAILKTE